MCSDHFKSLILQMIPLSDWQNPSITCHYKTLHGIVRLHRSKLAIYVTMKFSSRSENHDKQGWKYTFVRYSSCSTWQRWKNFEQSLYVLEHEEDKFVAFHKYLQQLTVANNRCFQSSAMAICHKTADNSFHSSRSFIFSHLAVEMEDTATRQLFRHHG